MPKVPQLLSVSQQQSALTTGPGVRAKAKSYHLEPGEGQAGLSLSHGPQEPGTALIEGTGIKDLGAEPRRGAALPPVGSLPTPGCPARHITAVTAASARSRQPASKQCLKPILIRLIYE